MKVYFQNRFRLFLLILPVFFGTGTTGFCAGRPSPGISIRTADAVYECIEKSYRVSKNGSHTLTLHVRVKVLTYKGKKDHADFRYPYNAAFQSVKILNAHTISPSGKIIPVGPRELHDITSPEDARATIYSRQRVKVVNFPSVTPGASVEITLERHSKKGFWATECFQLHDPIKIKTIRISLPSGTPLSVKVPLITLEHSEKTEKGRHIFRWEARDIPGMVREPLSPPYENRGTCLFLSTFSSWKKTGRFFASLFSKSPANKLGGIVKGKTRDALYMAFMKHFIVYPLDLFHTDLSFQSPEVTAKKGYGSPMDLAILFYSLLEQRGERPAFLLVNTGRIFIREFRNMPTPALFNSVIVRCGNSDYAFHARELPPGYTGLEGMMALDIQSGRLVSVQRRYPDRSVVRMVLHTTPDFTLEGTFSMKSEGTEAVSVRSWLRYKSVEEWRIAASQILHGLDPLARPLKPVVKKGVDTLTAPVLLSGEFRVPRLFPVNGGFSFVTAPPPDLPDGLKTCLESRRGPLMISRESTHIFEEKIVLPPGLLVRIHPVSSRGNLKTLEWEVAFSVHKNTLRFRRVIHLKRGILHPKTLSYVRFLQALKDLLRPSGRLIVFEKTNSPANRKEK